MPETACLCFGLLCNDAFPIIQPSNHCCKAVLQRATPAHMLLSFGRGKAGSLLALAHLVLSSTSMWVYGGFIRDLVLRADVYDSQDLDVGLPYEGLDAATAMSSIATLASGIGMLFLRTHPRGDPRVVRGFFQAVDSSVEVEVQVYRSRSLKYCSIISCHNANKCAGFSDYLQLRCQCAIRVLAV